ncbi:MAG: hypothetical protein AAGI23_18905 [Bacteroidota bacterium]
MKVTIEVTSAFAKNFKKLSKKYRSLKQDIALLQESLLENPYTGTKISEEFYKIRLQIKSKGKGKSGGGRVISFVEEGEETTLVVLMKLYDKSDQSSVTVVELREILEEFNSKR